MTQRQFNVATKYNVLCMFVFGFSLPFLVALFVVILLNFNDGFNFYLTNLKLSFYTMIVIIIFNSVNNNIISRH